MLSRLGARRLASCRRSAGALATAVPSEGGRRQHSTHNHQHTSSWLPLGAGASLVLGVYGLNRLRTAHADASAPSKKQPADSSHSPPARSDLPVYRGEEVKKHGRTADTVWVTYKGGVYDVTSFVERHPGGDKILMAAGGSIEPFWALYAQHKTEEVFEILESLRIGSLDPRDIVEVKTSDSSDPFRHDPARHPALIVNSQRPFNAESPPQLLMDNFRTPNELFFVRNHLPVPQTDAKTHRLQVEGVGIRRPMQLSVEELKKKFPLASVTSVVQCAGNRRADMNRFKKAAGLMWEGTAISNAKWSGARLRDILISMGVDPADRSIKHVHLEGADIDPTGKPYGASIPFEKAMQPETIIAWQMNDVDIPADHGAPLRCIVPGNVGARQVKWLTTIRTSGEESPSHWQQKDYRQFPPSVEMSDELKWTSVPSIQEYPVQSAFCAPHNGYKVDRADGTVSVSGYAWSGGGRGIIRVEVSPDGGQTWYSAEMQQDPEQDLEHMWAWTLFSAEIPIPKDKAVKEMQLVVKATDRAYNTQPETASGIWNVRGLLHNAWHRVNVHVRD